MSKPIYTHKPYIDTASGILSSIGFDTRKWEAMTAIYSSSALKTNQREIKDIALKEIVHITENGNGAFIFCSEELFQKKLQEAADEAAYEARMAYVIERGRAQIARGEYVEGDEVFKLFDNLERKLAAHDRD